MLRSLYEQLPDDNFSDNEHEIPIRSRFQKANVYRGRLKRDRIPTLSFREFTAGVLHHLASTAPQSSISVPSAQHDPIVEQPVLPIPTDISKTPKPSRKRKVLLNVPITEAPEEEKKGNRGNAAALARYHLLKRTAAQMGIDPKGRTTAELNKLIEDQKRENTIL
jgi:hypothetical protein